MKTYNIVYHFNLILLFCAIWSGHGTTHLTEVCLWKYFTEPEYLSFIVGKKHCGSGFFVVVVVDDGLTVCYFSCIKSRQ